MADALKNVLILGEEYDIHDASLRNFNHLVWRLLFEAMPQEIAQEETKLKQDAEAFSFFQRAYNVAYLLSILNQQKLEGCRVGPLKNLYLPKSDQDPYLVFKSYLGREKAKDFLRYLNKWIPVYSVK